MSHPSHHARTHPDKIAYRMARSGDAISYRELDARSNQGAQLFRSLGRLRARAAAHADRQADEAPAARPLLAAGHGAALS
jgi:acyl-CoA synthetase (AMP-forming)/AMP-acid ligase II